MLTVENNDYFDFFTHFNLSPIQFNFFGLINFEIKKKASLVISGNSVDRNIPDNHVFVDEATAEDNVSHSLEGIVTFFFLR